jgi:hypothetical protein
MIGLALTACSTTTYYKPGFDHAEFDQDNFACEQASLGVAASTPLYAPNITSGGWVGVSQSSGVLMNVGQNLAQQGQQVRLYKLCMKARGYSEGMPPVTRARAVAPAPVVPPAK